MARCVSRRNGSFSAAADSAALGGFRRIRFSIEFAGDQLLSLRTQDLARRPASSRTTSGSVSQRRTVKSPEEEASGARRRRNASEKT